MVQTPMVAPTQPKVSPDLQALTLAQAPMPRADQERKLRMREAWKAYRGDFQAPLKVSANQQDDNVIVNRCSPVVVKGVSFLFGPVLKIEDVSEVAASANNGISFKQAFVNGLWGDDDERMTLLSQMAINGGVCGEVFIKLIPAQGQMKYPRLVVLDPMLVRIVTAPDDCSLILAYIIEYPGLNNTANRQIIARVDPDGLAGVAGEYDLDDFWTITNYCQTVQNGTYFQIGEQQTWPYPFAPIFCCQNLPNPNEPWGEPDLTQDLINVNKVLNFIQSNVARILKFHAHPKTYGTGFQADQMFIGVDDLVCLPSPDAKISTVEMHSDLASSLNFASVLRSDMDEQSRVPAVALGRMVDMPKGNISGVALQLLFQPLLEKTVQKQRLYGCLIREVTRAAMVVASLLDIDSYEAYPIELHWQNLLPVDDLAAAQTAVLLQQLGVSVTTILQQLGYNPDDEAVKRAIEVTKHVPPANGKAPAGQPQTDPQPNAGQAQQAIQQDIQQEEQGSE